jgi:subtilisin family serine protease
MGGIMLKALGLALAAAAVLLGSGVASAKTFNLEHEHVPGQLIVRFKGDIKAESKMSFLKSMGVASVETFSASGAALLTFAEKGSTKALAARAAVLAKRPDVAWVEANTILRISGRRPNDTDFALQYALHNDGTQTGSIAGADIKALGAWEVTTGSKQVLVGVIDTGVDYRHPDLAGNYWFNPGETGLDANGRDKATNGIDDDNNGYVDDFRGWNFVGNNNDPMDDHDHGTHCAGVIGASTDNGVGMAGVNWNVSMVGIKFLSASGGGTLVDAVRSIEYATKIGVTMTSNSWGGGGYSETMVAAITDARNKGILFVAAAGNDARSNETNGAYPASYQVENIISVAATDNKDTLARFSNFGATSVHVAAPGVDIWSTTKAGQYRRMSGTSMATPHVAGVAALIKAAHPEVDYNQVKARLVNSSDPVPALVGKVVAAGRVNARDSLATDSIAPGPASALQVVSVTRNSVSVSFAPAGDDGDVGFAKSYEIRTAATPIVTLADWNSASRANAMITLNPDGANVTATINGLAFNAEGYFAVRARDKVGNIGEVSESAPFAVQRVRVVASQRTDSLDGVVATGDWGIETLADSGRQVFSDSPAGPYRDSMNSTLTLPAMTVPSSAVSLAINTAYSLEAGYDFGFIEISKDGGVTWQQVARLTGQSAWTNVSWDLANLLGDVTTFSLRFKFTSDSSIPDDGWKIADIQLIGVE